MKNPWKHTVSDEVQQHTDIQYLYRTVLNNFRALWDCSRSPLGLYDEPKSGINSGLDSIIETNKLCLERRLCMKPEYLNPIRNGVQVWVYRVHDVAYT
jgi:hypothetical protein